MLLLVTIGLVVVGAVALVIGFVSNSLGPIYLSIACSVIAGVVLVVFSRIARRSDSGSSSAAPASASPGSWAPSTASAPPPTPAPGPTVTPSYQPPPAPPSRPPPPRRSEPEPTIVLDEPVRAAAPRAAAPRVAPRAAAPGVGDADDGGFPIDGYDKMRSSQIVAVLATLDLDELDMVQEREEQGKNRATVLRRVVERIDQLEADDMADAPVDEEPADDAVEDFPAATDDDFPAVAADDDGFPIAGYDELSAEEIIAVLDDLEDDELDLVAEREEQGRNRVEILDYIDDMFEEVDGGEPAPAPVVSPRSAARPAAKKSAAKKATAKKAAAPRKSAAKKDAPVASGRKAASVAKAPARKAAAGRVAAARVVASPGTKAAGRKAAAPAAKAAKTPARAVPGRAAAKKATKVAAKKAAASTRKR